MTRTVAHYERLEQIGEGTYGQVYRAKCLDSGRIVAMKKMRIISRYVNGIPPQLIREIKILKQLRHPNLLRMIEVVTSKGAEDLDPDDPVSTGDNSRNKKEEEDPIALARERYKGNLFLVLEYVTHDLTGLMDVAYQFTTVQIKCIFQQLLKALQYMHEHKLVHRDIKSSNILIDSQFRLKLADFGLARSLEPPLLNQVDVNSSGSVRDLTNKVITLWYRSPEILLGTVDYSFGVDIWSAGCILAELLLNKPLAAGKSELEQLRLVATLTGTPDKDTWDHLFSLRKTKNIDREITEQAAVWGNCSDRKGATLREKFCNKRGIDPVAVNLLEKLLEWDPRKRLTAGNALENKYFWSHPKAPDRPEDLGRLDVAEDGHFHEFQTKQKRREAKQVADRKRAAAIVKGKSESEASALYDEVYQGIMNKVAKEGFKNKVPSPKPVVDDLPKQRNRSTAEIGSSRERGNDVSGDRGSGARRHPYRDSDEESDRKRRKKRRRDEDPARESRRRSSKDRSRRSDEEKRDRRSRKDDESVDLSRRSNRHRRVDSREKDRDESSERRRRRKGSRHKSSKKESRRRRDYDRDDYREGQGFPGQRSEDPRDGYIPEPGGPLSREDDRMAFDDHAESRRRDASSRRRGEDPVGRDLTSRDKGPPRDFDMRPPRGDFPRRNNEDCPPWMDERRRRDFPRGGDRADHFPSRHERGDAPPPRNRTDGPPPRNFGGPPRRDDPDSWREWDDRPPHRRDDEQLSRRDDRRYYHEDLPSPRRRDDYGAYERNPNDRNRRNYYEDDRRGGRR